MSSSAAFCVKEEVVRQNGGELAMDPVFFACCGLVERCMDYLDYHRGVITWEDARLLCVSSHYEICKAASCTPLLFLIFDVFLFVFFFLWFLCLCSCCGGVSAPAFRYA